LLLIGSSNLPQPTQEPGEPGKIEVASYKLHIGERAGKCILSYDGHSKGKISMIIPPPCEFLRDHNDTAQHFRYKNTKRKGGGYFEVILVVGGPLDKGQSDKFMKDGCGTQIQAISLSRRGVVAGAVGSGIVVCPSRGLDEKNFGFLAKQI
jgi:hypothetical protein